MFYSQGNITVNSYNFSHQNKLAKNVMKANVAIHEMTPPDEDGYMSFGPGGAYHGRYIADLADTVIVQVNRELPRVYGSKDCYLHVSDVNYIVEGDHGVPELPDMGGASDEDRKIAELISERIPDGACLQAGLGGIPNTVCELMEGRKDLGVHAELIPDGLVDLVEKGIVNCSKKNLHPGKIITPIAIGTSKIYNFVKENPLCEFHPIAYVNDPRVIGQNDNVASVQSALMVDLTGQVASESIGHNMVSGTGGQFDFVMGANLSNGGQSFLALRSARAKKEGEGVKSRIVLEFPPGTVVSTPRSIVQYIVTEYGIVNLQDRSIPDRVRLMISIAHPDVRETLLQEAKQAGLLAD
jgi:4-hydroxybutyrate CoA-transferase